MTETTEYVPVAEVPDWTEMLAAMKADAKEHPEYGSCPHCIKAVRVDKFGRLREHNTPELARGALKATFKCPGSGRSYAEHGDFGETWDLQAGRWIELPVDAPVLLVAHDRANVPLPLWQVVDVAATEITRRAVKALLEGTKWRVELTFADGVATAYLVRLDRGDRGPTVWESKIDSEHFVRVAVKKLLDHLDATDYSDRVAARSE